MRNNRASFDFARISPASRKLCSAQYVAVLPQFRCNFAAVSSPFERQISHTQSHISRCESAATRHCRVRRDAGRYCAPGTTRTIGSPAGLSAATLSLARRESCCNRRLRQAFTTVCYADQPKPAQGAVRGDSSRCRPVCRTAAIRQKSTSSALDESANYSAVTRKS